MGNPSGGNLLTERVSKTCASATVHMLGIFCASSWQPLYTAQTTEGSWMHSQRNLAEILQCIVASMHTQHRS